MCEPRLCHSFWEEILVLRRRLGAWGWAVCRGLWGCRQRGPDQLYWLQEFEVIAQIKLLQSACNNYSFTQEDHFVDWFHSLERLSEAER